MVDTSHKQMSTYRQSWSQPHTNTKFLSSHKQTPLLHGDFLVPRCLLVGCSTVITSLSSVAFSSRCRLLFNPSSPSDTLCSATRFFSVSDISVISFALGSPVIYNNQIILKLLLLLLLLSDMIKITFSKCSLAGNFIMNNACTWPWHL